jgi:hypothetical protein
MDSDSSEEELRRRYLDWCSTQVAKRFLELSLDEVWLRSRTAGSLPTTGSPPLADSGQAADRIPSYLDLVRKTTLLIASEMDLPDFADWVEEYRRDPTHFEKEILG